MNLDRKMTISRWIHLQELASIYWVHPILGALNDAAMKGKFRHLNEDEREVSAHISIKLNIITRIMNRLALERNQLLEFIKSNQTSNNISTVFKPKAALPVDDDLKYNLISDIESYILQLDACWDRMKDFTIILNSIIGNTLDRKTVIQYINDAHNNHDSTAWISLLAKHRNFITHDGASYLAIDASDNNNENWNFLILKYLRDKLDNPEEFFSLTDLDTIHQGFIKSSLVLQSNLMSIFR
jgi:hypothetical protein